MSTPERQGPWDTGLQPERTTLSWVRTGLTMMVVCLLASRLARDSGVAALVLALTGTVVAAALVSMESRRYRRRDHRLRNGDALRPALGPVLLATVLTAGLAVACVLLIVVPALLAAG